MQIKYTNWIWKPNFLPHEKDSPVFIMFRKTFEITSEPKEACIQISADTRYKLYVNGNLIEVGPSRGDCQVWFYDQINLKEYLKKGKNCIAVYVLRYPLEHGKGNFGMFRTEHPGLYVAGDIICECKQTIPLYADSTWKCRIDKERNILSESEFFAPLQIYEEASTSWSNNGWLYADFDDSDWDNSVPYINGALNCSVSPGNLFPRNIPFMYRLPKRFHEVLKVENGDKQQWDLLIQESKEIEIPPHTVTMVEISAKVLMTGYLKLSLKKGMGSKIKIVQAESYLEEKADPGVMALPKKGNRTDFENGILDGFFDIYHVGGVGNEQFPETYETFWFRTFRFVKLIIETAEEPLHILDFTYEETGYPLQVKTKVETSDPTLQDIWEISKRTLSRCMHETYEDCPYYEQLQYAMDTRTQILYTYMVAADDRLARKCMDDFRRSQRSDGLLNCCYPSYGPNVIPGFSIYYILMLEDHMMFYGDKELIEDHITTVHNILRYFKKNLDSKGYVKKIGGLNIENPLWSFIDWTPEWNDTTGVPKAILVGAITMESLLYLYGLQSAAKLADYIGRKELAKEYQVDADNLGKSILKYCIGNQGMLRDGPCSETYSQHTQVFGILTGLLSKEEGKQILNETLDHPNQYAQCSVAMSYYLFRAMERVELYDHIDSCWNLWRNMIKMNLTTCVEDNIGQRSDCHAWGAVALYELPAAILGVRPASPGYGTVSIKPLMAGLSYAKGQVITPKGMVYVDWKKNGENIGLTYQLPDQLKIEREDNE